MPGRGRRRNSCKVVTAVGDNNDLSRKAAKIGRAGVTTRASASSSVTLATSSRQAHSLPPLLPTLPRVAAELDSSPLYPVQESNSTTKRHLTSPPVDESQVRQQLSSTDSSLSVSSKKKRSVMNLEDSLSRYFTTKSEKRSVRIPTKFDEMLLIDCAASSSSNNSKPYHNGLGNNIISGKLRLPTDSSMSLNGRRGKRTAAPTTTATSANRKRSSTNVAESSSRHRSSSVCCDQRLHRRRGRRKASSRFDPSKIAVATTTAITDISNKATKKGKTRGVISDSGGTLKEHGLTSRRRGRRSKAAITTTPVPNVLHFTSSYRQHHHNQEQQQQSTRRHTSEIASSHHLRSAVFANTNFAVANIDAASTTTIDTNIMTSPLADRRLTLPFEDRINFKKRRPRPRPTPPVLSRSLRLAARQLSSSVKFLPSKNEKEIINPLTSVDFYSESVPVNAVAHKCSVDKTTSSYRSGVNTRSSNCKLTIMYSSPDTKRKPRRTDNASAVAATANIRRRRRYRRNKKTIIKKERASSSRQTTTIVTRNSKARALSYSFNSLPTAAAPSVTVTPHSIQSVSIAEQSNEAVDLPAVTSYLPSLRSSRSSTCILPKQLVSPPQKSIKHEINCDDFQQDFINKEHMSFPVNIDNQLKVDRSTSFQDSQQLVPAYLNKLNNQFSTISSDNDDNRFIVDDADLNHFVPNSQLPSLRFSSVECLETKLPADSNEALQGTQFSTDALTEPIVIKSTTSGRYNKFRAAKGLRNNTATTIRDEQQHIGHRSKRVLSGTTSTNDSITLTTNIYQHDDGGECCTFKSVSYHKKGRTAARHHGTASRITRASVFLDKAAEQLKEQINREISTNNIPLDLKKDSKTCCNKSKCMESVPAVTNRNRSPIHSSNEREQLCLLGVCGHASTTDIQLDHIKSIKNDIQNSVDKPKKKLGRPRKVVPVDPITPDLMNQPTFGNYATPMKPIRSVKKNMKLSQCNDGSNDYRCAQIKLEATQQHSISEECTGQRLKSLLSRNEISSSTLYTATSGQSLQNSKLYSSKGYKRSQSNKANLTLKPLSTDSPDLRTIKILMQDLIRISVGRYNSQQCYIRRKLRGLGVSHPPGHLTNMYMQAAQVRPRKSFYKSKHTHYCYPLNPADIERTQRYLHVESSLNTSANEDLRDTYASSDEVRFQKRDERLNAQHLKAVDDVECCYNDYQNSINDTSYLQNSSSFAEGTLSTARKHALLRSRSNSPHSNSSNQSLRIIKKRRKKHIHSKSSFSVNAAKYNRSRRPGWSDSEASVSAITCNSMRSGRKWHRDHNVLQQSFIGGDNYNGKYNDSSFNSAFNQAPNSIYRQVAYLNVEHDDVDMFNESLQRTSMQCTKLNVHQNSDKIELPSIITGGVQIKAWCRAPYPAEYAAQEKLYICEFCLTYLKSKRTLLRHVYKCNTYGPPGEKIYENCDHSIFEVNGGEHTIFCQNLCLLAKLFLDHKTLHSDVEPFLFYVLTKRDSKGYHIIGYFSKEKSCGKNYNLSCIMVLPNYQKLGYGSFLIDFSYLLSRKQHEIGTPEKPLSQLGRISYNSYWKKVALRHLAKTSRELNLSRLSLTTGILPSDLFEGLRIAEVITLRDDKLVILRDMDKFQSYKGPFSSNLVMPSESETMLTKAFNQLSSTTSSAAASDYCKLLAKCVDDDAMDSNNNDNGDYNNCKEHLSNKSKSGLSNDIFHCVGPHRSLCVYSGVNRMRYNHSQRVRRKYVRLMNRRALRQSGYSQSTTEISKVLRAISCRVSLQNAFGLHRSADIDSPMTLQRFDIPQGGGSAFCCFNGNDAAGATDDTIRPTFCLPANLKDCNHDNRSYGTSCQHVMMHHVKVPKQKATEMNNCKLQSSTSSAPVLLINKRQLSVNDQHLTATTNPALSPYLMSDASSDASIAIDNDDNDEDYKNLSLQSNEGSSSECLLNDSEQNFDKPTSAVKQQQWLSVNSSEVSSHNVSAGCTSQNQQNSSANTMSSSTLSSFILSPTFVYSLKSESSSSNADFQDMEQRELSDENHEVDFDHNELDSEKMISPSILDDSPKSVFADKGIIHSGSKSISSLRNNVTGIYNKDCNVVESTLSQNAEECLLDQVVIRKTDQLIDYRRTDCVHHHNLKEEIASSLSSLSTDEPQSIVSYNINNAKDVKTFNGNFMQRKAVLSNIDDDVHRLVNADLSVSRTTLLPEQQHSAVTELSSLHSPTTAQVPIGTHGKMNKDTSCNHGKATFDRPEHITQKKDVVESALLQRPDSEHRLLSSGFAVQRFDENQPQLLSSPVHPTAPVDGQQRCFSNSSCSDDQQRRIIDSRVQRVDQRHITNVNGQIRTPHIFYDQQQHQHRQQRQRCLSGQASYPCSSKHIPVPPVDHHQNNGNTSVQWSLDLPPSHHSCFDKQIYAAQIKRPGTAPPLNYQEGYNNGDGCGTRIFYDDPVKRSFNVQAQQEQHPQLHFNCMRSPIVTSVSAAEFSASTNNHEREVLSRTCSAQYDNHLNYRNSLDRMPFPDSLAMHNRQHLSSSSLPFTNPRDNSIAQERILSSSANFVHPPHQIKQHFSVPPTSSQMFAVNDQSQQHRHNQSMNYFDNDIPTALIAADNLNSNFIMNSHQQEVINCANVNSNPYSSNADNNCNVVPSCQHRPPFPQNCFNNTYNCDGGNVSIKSNRHPCCARPAYCYHSNVNRVFGCASSEGGTSVSNADLPVMRSKSCHPPQDSRFPTHVPNINNDNTVEGCNNDNDYSHHRAVMQAGSATTTCVEPQRLVRQPKTMVQHQQQQIAMQHQQVHSSLHNAMMIMTPQQGTTNQLISDSNNADNDFQPHYPPYYQGLNGNFSNDGSNNVNINNSTFNPVEITSISLANYHPHDDMYYSSNNNEEISNAAAQFLNHHDAGVGMLSNERRQAMSPVNGDPTPLLMLPSHVDNRHQIAQAHSYPPRANRSHPSASVFVANNRRMSASPSDLSYSHHHNRQQYQQQPPNTDYHYNNEFPMYSAQTKHNVAANLQMVMYPQHTFMSLSGNGTNDSDDNSNVVGCTNITNATDTSAMPSLLYYAANGQSTTNDSIVAATPAKST